MLDQGVDAIHSTEPATVSKVSGKLQAHVKTAECDVSTYLDEDGTIVVLVSPGVPQPSSLQVEACVQEASKLQSLVDQRSPTLVTEFPLSAVTGSYRVQRKTSGSLGGRLVVGSGAVQVACLVLTLWFLMTGKVT